eukprot:2296954-Prymnesium_polylepis.1
MSLRAAHADRTPNKEPSDRSRTVDSRATPKEVRPSGHDLPAPAKQSNKPHGSLGAGNCIKQNIWQTSGAG